MTSKHVSASGLGSLLKAGVGFTRLPMTMTGMASLVLVAMLTVLYAPGLAHGQIFPMANGTITTCTGALVDSGGEGGPGYSNNEDVVTTICPDQPGEGISLNFVTFNLSLAGAAPSDVMIAYDGASTADPILGSFGGNDLSGSILFTSPTNTSGCITLQFISNATGTGAFAATITCYTPCVPPTAVATVGENVPVLACQGETFTFDGSASFAAPGFSLVDYSWNFDDSTTASTSVVEHAFDEPGEYMVQLTVTDDNGCTNTALVDLQVLVSTTPSFSGTSLATNVCEGTTVDLTGNGTAVTWSAIPVVDFGGGVFLPDNVGQTFSSELTFTQFSPGSTLTSIDQLLGICMDMEHSFMGDLVVSIRCPNNQSVVMHQQGGGGTYLGAAIDGDEANPTPGTCWNYCFSPDATLGTWVDCAAFGATPNVMPSGTAQALIPGTYTSLNSLAGLVGCPLNGTWTISFTDLWGADNGFLCGWNIDMDPALYPDLTEFTPVLGSTADSTGWSGTDVVQDPLSPGNATFTSYTAGNYDLVYSVTDNFGCTYDTTIVITVRPPPQVAASATSVGLCEDPARLRAMIVANGLPPGSSPLVYSWAPAAGTTNPNVAEPFTNITVPTLFQITVFPSGQPWCSSTDSVLVLPPSFLENDSVVVNALCHGGEGTITINTIGPGGPWNYEWRNAQNSIVRSTDASNGDALQAPVGTYTVYISESADGNGCLDTLVATINEPELLVWSSVPADTTICLTGQHTLEAGTTGGTQPIELIWSGGLAGNGPHSVSPATTTDFNVVAVDANGCTSDTLSATVFVREPLLMDSLLSFERCRDVPFTLNATNVSGGDGSYVYTWSNGALSMPSMTDSLQFDETICLTLSDGCETPPFVTCAAVTVLQTPPLVLTADSTFGCAPFQLRFALQDTTGSASIAWDFGDGFSATGPDSINHIYGDAGRYDVTTVVTWPNGCITDTTIVQMVRVIPVPVPDFTWEPKPLTVLEPVAQFVELAAPNEVSYAWDFFAFGTSDAPDPIVTFPNDIGRFYPVQLLVRNELGCADSVTRNVHVEDEFLVHVPNAFSPNGDGINEEFRVLGNDLSPDEFQLVIFDRWGREVFFSTDRDVPWRGALGAGEGEILPQGVYAWRLNVRSLQTLQKRIIMGHVTLLR